MKLRYLLAAGGICMVLLSACAGKPADGNGTAALTTEETTMSVKETTREAETSAAGAGKAYDAVDPEKVTRIVFDYDMFNRYSLRAVVTDLSAAGAKLEIKKTTGPMNNTGFRKEGKLTLGREETEELLKILGRYDIRGMSGLPKTSGSSAPRRSLYVFEGEERLGIAFNTDFPETIPPVEDIMYYELFNFFNGRISGEPGWEDVRTEDLPDPRKDPAYGERTASWFGNTVRLVPGTGTHHDTGAGAVIDYGSRIWWQEEGFIGTFSMTEQDREYTYRTADDASLTVKPDGSVVLMLDGTQWTGTLGKTRRYREGIPVSLRNGSAFRDVTIWNLREDSYAELEVRCYPGPVPEPQFPPVDIRLSDPGWKKQDPAPVSAIEWRYSRSGMMNGDYETSSMKLFTENGEGRFIFTEMKPYQPETIRVYRVEDEVFERLKELSEQHDLEAWDPKLSDPDSRVFALDETFSQSLTLTFPDPAGEEDDAWTRSVDWDDTEGEDSEIFRGLYSLLKNCVKDENLLETRTEKNPYEDVGNPASGSAKPPAPGMWTCPSCGYAENKGKFCSECGSPRPK